MVLDRNDFWQIQVVSYTKKDFGHFQIGLLAPSSFFFVNVNSRAFFVVLHAMLNQIRCHFGPVFNYLCPHFHFLVFQCFLYSLPGEFYF